MKDDRMCFARAPSHGLVAGLVACLVACSAAWAQPDITKTGQNSLQRPPVLPDTLQIAEQTGTRSDPRFERIHVEDSGSSIDEVRIGGETRSLTVQPRVDVPAYEFRPTDGSRRPQHSTDTGSPRVWNLLRF
jgi:hypothetical protein